MATDQDDITLALTKRHFQTGKTALTFACILLILGLLLSACSTQEAGRKSRAGRWTQFEGQMQPAITSPIRA